jgi:hypothetical protein
MDEPNASPTYSFENKTMDDLTAGINENINDHIRKLLPVRGK